MRGVFNRDGSATVASVITQALALNAVRKVMRGAMDSGAAAAIGLPREFIVALPYGGATAKRNPRPFSDQALRTISDTTNIALLADMDLAGPRELIHSL